MQKWAEFCHWIREREKVRLLKEAGAAKPWSTDWVFQQVYFCNVHREDDRVTRWIRQNWPRPPNEPTWHEFAMCVARLLNWPPSLELIGYPNDVFSPQQGWISNAIDTLRAQAASGKKVWGNAYVVTTHGQKIDKLTYLEGLLKHMADFPMHEEILMRTTLKQAHEYLTGFEGFGSFMAGQVVADLKNSKGHHLQKADDWWTWSAPGPGSMRGLQWLYGHRITPSQYDQAIYDIRNRLGEDLPALEICAQDVQNCLCEFDKYCRVRTRSGRSKRSYNGTAS